MKIESHLRFRSFLAAITACSLTSIYPYLEMNRNISFSRSAWLAIVSLFLCPFIVCWIAGRRFIIWGVITNLLLLLWLFLMVYVIRGAWHELKLDASGLGILCLFGLLSGTGVGGFVERQYKRLCRDGRAA
jgi:uncharacterized membrane protein